MAAVLWKIMGYGSYEGISILLYVFIIFESSELSEELFVNTDCEV